jgi:NitT/TauT family transport system substrate-binding protein
MKTKIVRDLVLFFIATVVLIVTGCGSTSPPPEAERRAPLRLPYFYWGGLYPLLVAKAKGFFDRQGVEVELIFIEDFLQILPEFAAGKFDGFDMPPDAPSRLLAKNSNMRVVLLQGACDGCDEIVARPEIRTVADLKGKKIGVQVGGFGELFVEEMMKTAGLTIADVQLISADEKLVSSYLKNDTIQAGHTWEPFATQAVNENAGAKVIFSTKQARRLVSDTLAFRDTVLRERPDDIRAYLRAWFQGVEYMRNPANAKEISEIVGKALNVPPDDILHDHDDFEYFTLEEAKKAFDSSNGPSLVFSVLQKHAEFLVKIGALRSRPDLDQIIDPSFLPSETPR